MPKSKIVDKAFKFETEALAQEIEGLQILAEVRQR